MPIKDPVTIKRVFLCVLLFFVTTTIQAQSLAQTETVRLAVIPGVGKAQPPEFVTAQLEVELSNLEDITLVERRQINQVLQEITLGAAGYQDTKQTVAIGHLVNANILFFVEQVAPDRAIGGMTADEPDIIRIRMVESRSGIVLGSFMESFEDMQSGLEAILPAVRSVIAKQKVALGDRHYIGILDIKNNEPGTLLDGKAAALKMFLSMDLGRLPHVFVLDRENLQYLQTEKALTGMALQLKQSAVLLTGGLQFEPGQEKIRITIRVRPIGAGRQFQDIELLADKSNLDEARVTITNAVLKMFDSEMTVTDQAPLDQAEGKLFLRQVPLYLSSGDLQAAVNHAEAAYALLSTQEARYWASLAWYTLGWDLIQKSIPDSFRPGRVMGRSRVKLLNTRFSPGNTSALKTRDRGGRAGSIVRKISRVGSRSADRRSFAQSSQRVGPRSAKSGQGEQDNHKPKKDRDGDFIRHDSSVMVDKKIRYLSALIRSYSLLEEMTYIHQRDYASGHQKNIILRTPRDRYKESSSNQPQLRRPRFYGQVRNDHAQVQSLFNELVMVQNNVNKLQRDFYFRHYTDSVKAQEFFWKTWKDKASMISKYWGVHPEMSPELFEEVMKDYLKTSQCDFSARVKGVMGVLTVGVERYFSENEIKLFQRLTTHDDAFIRLIANKQLLRVDPLKFSEQTIQLFVEEFPYDHPCRQMDDAAFVPDFLKPAFHRLAISKQNKMLPLGKQLFDPIFKHQDMIQLIAFRDWLWPYVIGLEQSGDVKSAIDVVDQSIQVLEKKDYANFSAKAKLLRAELDLKLFQLGQKEKRDPKFEHYFSLIDIPAYVRLNPQVEPPRLNLDPIDISVFQPVTLPTKGRNTTTNSTASSVMTAQYSGDKFSQSYTRVINVESNEIYTMSNMDAQQEKKKKGGPWEEYKVRRIPLERVQLQTVMMRGPRREMPPLQKQHLLDDNQLFFLSQERMNDNLVITASQHRLQKQTASFRLGKVSVPLGHIKDYFPYYVNAMAVGPDQLYVGTAGGLIVFSLKGRRASSPGDDENLSLLRKPKLITEKDGFPGNHILSLAYFQDKLYVGIGPLAKSPMGLIGNCGLAAYDPATGTYQIIASSRSEENHDVFGQGETYQITSILGDEERDCLWLGIAGNSKFNGIWKYDVTSGQIVQVIREDQGIRAMRWTGDHIVYFLNQCGLVRFDPETTNRTWLVAQAKSDKQVNAEPQPPKEYDGYPLYGAPKSRLWPFVIFDERMFMIGWDRFEIMIKDKGQPTQGKSVFNPRVGVAEIKALIDQNEQGIWIVTQYGNVYLVQKK
ncbi:MAG: hypothetical protein K8S27_07395 [Candidatus Omnitrophica bacterium]|nr:hypothetical protein [Candidatus Omnitrophota bacterium]